MQNILEIKNVYKKIGKKEILNDVSFNVKSGEILGFIGPNGAGKTTTIKLIMGLQSLDKGTITINGYDAIKDHDKALSKVGSIIENPDFYGYLSGYDNLKLIYNTYNLNNSKVIMEVVKEVGLTNRIYDKVSKYSLGMKERLAIAASLINNPNLLILDEPTNGLDPEGIKDLRNLLINLAKKEHIAILISSHNLAELDNFITDACLIENGHIIECLPINELKQYNKESYLIELDNTKDILDIKNNNIDIVSNNTIKIYCSKKDIPNYIDLLIKNKKKIYGIKENAKTLEEAFLDMAGGNKIV